MHKEIDKAFHRDVLGRMVVADKTVYKKISPMRYISIISIKASSSPLKYRRKLSAPASIRFLLLYLQIVKLKSEGRLPGREQKCVFTANRLFKFNLHLLYSKISLFPKKI